MHRSVGAIIKNEKGEILMQDRAQFPFGWACPAGHVDDGETFADGLAREVKEETGLEVVRCELLIHEFVPWNECVKGAKGHDWQVFKVAGWVGEAKPSREAKEMKWVNAREIKNLQLERVWQHWFNKLGIKNDNSTP